MAMKERLLSLQRGEEGEFSLNGESERTDREPLFGLSELPDSLEMKLVCFARKYDLYIKPAT